MSDRVLLIDDDSELLQSHIRALRKELPGVNFDAAGSLEKALPILKEHQPSAVLLDLCLDEDIGIESGFTALFEITRLYANTRVIVLTGHGSPESGVRALREGAASFLEKPANMAHLAALICDGIRQSNLLREYARLRESHDNNSVEELIIGKGASIKALRDRILYLAASPQSLLITGETGTGKGLVAKAIHRLGPRRNKPFIIYCPSFANPSLQNSELFGHTRGAFTGADRSRKGLIAEAEGGTLFLDDIDALPLEVQANLLHVLQERSFRPLGSNQEQKADFRLIAATNQDPEKCIEYGRLRLDIYHRIAHEQVHLAPLRERTEDIEELAGHFLGQLRNEEDISVRGFEHAARKKLLQAPWRGNVRELQGIVRSAAYKAQWEGRTEIVECDLNILPAGGRGEAVTLQEQLDFHRQRIMYSTLDRFGGNQTQAAKALGVSRGHLRRLMEKEVRLSPSQCDYRSWKNPITR